MRIQFIFLGKTRRAECRTMFEDYAARIRHYATIEITELREDSAALRKFKLEPATAVVLLDAAGKHFSTAEFAKWIGAQRDRGGAQALVFLCGGAAGFPEELRRAATAKLSLSSMTMPHELARVVLAEQIYRAFTILGGHPYSK
jgi:23S rRNA (pseudouridine1915-N3)-methyltransferase